MDDQDRFIIRQREFWAAIRRIGAKFVVCRHCQVTNPYCFLGDQKGFPVIDGLLVSKCERCKRKGDAPKDEKSLETQWALLRDKGICNTQCYCGEENPFCFEADHLDGQKFSDRVFGCCINCHLIRTRRQQSEYFADNFGRKNQAAVSRNRLRGIREYLELVAAQIHDPEEFLHNIAVEKSDSRLE